MTSPTASPLTQSKPLTIPHQEVLIDFGDDDVCSAPNTPTTSVIFPFLPPDAAQQAQASSKWLPLQPNKSTIKGPPTPTYPFRSPLQEDCSAGGHENGQTKSESATSEPGDPFDHQASPPMTPNRVLNFKAAKSPASSVTSASVRSIKVIRSRSPPSFFSSRGHAAPSPPHSPHPVPSFTSVHSVLQDWPTERGHDEYDANATSAAWVDVATSPSSNFSPASPSAFSHFQLARSTPVRVRPPPGKPLRASNEALGDVLPAVNATDTPSPSQVPLPVSASASEGGTTATSPGDGDKATEVGEETEAVLRLRRDPSPDPALERLTRSFSQWPLRPSSPVESLTGNTLKSLSTPSPAQVLTPNVTQSPPTAPAARPDTSSILGQLDTLQDHCSAYDSARGVHWPEILRGLADLKLALLREPDLVAARTAPSSDRSLLAEIDHLRKLESTFAAAEAKRRRDITFLTERCKKIGTACEQLKKDKTEAKLREEIWRSKLESIRDQYDHLLKDRQHWHKREMLLGEQYVELENELAAAQKELLASQRPPEPEKLNLTIILLEISADSVITIKTKVCASLLKKGSAGGSELASAILDILQTQSEKVMLQIFINFPEVRRALIKRDIIEKQSQLHDFFDGLCSGGPLFSVIDTDVPGRKMRDHLELYGDLPARQILIGCDDGEAYRPLLEKLAGRRKVALAAIRSTSSKHHLSDLVTKDRFLTVNGLFSPSRSISIKCASQITSELDQRHDSNSKASSEKKRPAAVIHSSRAGMISSLGHAVGGGERKIPDNAPPKSAYSSSVSMSDKTSLRSYSPASTMEAEARRPPWVRDRIVEKPRDISPETPYWERPGTLMSDHALQNHTVSSPTLSSISITPRRQPWQEALTVAHNDDRPPTGNRSGLLIPVGEPHSLAGSPVSSDEDHPSAIVPHSAVKRVQRPIEFSRPDETTRPESPRAHVNSGSAIASAYAARRTASSTHGQLLGGDRTESGTIHGFRYHRGG